MQTLPNGFLVLPGKSEIKIYDDEEEQVMALVRDEVENQKVQIAKRDYDGRLKQYAEEKCGGDMELAKQTCPESVPSVYCQQNKGSKVIGIRPLLSARVIERDLPPPEKEGIAQASADTAKIISMAMQVILSNKELRRQLASELKEEIFELENEQDTKVKNRKS